MNIKTIIQESVIVVLAFGGLVTVLFIVAKSTVKNWFEFSRAHLDTPTIMRGT